MKLKTILIMTCIFPLIFTGCTNSLSKTGVTTTSATKGSSAETDIKTAKLLAYPVPEGTPSEEKRFSVTANGQEVGIYSDINAWGNEVHFGCFDFDSGFQVEIKITVKFKFDQVKVLPERLNIKPVRNGQDIIFTIKKPVDDMTFVFDDSYIGYVLHLFTNEIDHNAPERNSANVIYFGPGYHDLKRYGGELQVTSGKTLYLAGGAVIGGPVNVLNADHVTIKGSGVILMDQKNSANPQYGNIALTINHSSNVTVSGIVAQSHRIQNWTTHVYFSNNVAFERYRTVSPRYASTDGLDISNSQDVSVNRSFLRACDDTITIKGLSNADSPEDAPANENINVTNTTLWNDCNNAMVLGEESKAKYYKNITFKNIDVLFSYDDLNNHEDLDERAVISIVSLHGTTFSDVLWEDIRVNECERLVCFTFKDSFWFGSIRGDQSFPGKIDGITLRNITSKSTSTSSIANEVLMNGWDAKKMVSNVRFDHVVINGTEIKNMDKKYFKINEFVKDILFK